MDSTMPQIPWTLCRIRDGIKRRVARAIGQTPDQWARVVMDQETHRYVKSLDYSSMSVLEISGDKWKNFGFADYREVGFPQYDVCKQPLEFEKYDLIISEQVFEHVLWPYRAARNVCSMLKPGGRFIITTPFLLRVHDCPVDCSRWTPLGMKHFLVEAGFSFEQTIVGSWGNRACARSNLNGWTAWIPWWHSLKNDPTFAVVVWAFARKPFNAL